VQSPLITAMTIMYIHSRPINLGRSSGQSGRCGVSCSHIPHPTPRPSIRHRAFRLGIIQISNFAAGDNNNFINLASSPPSPVTTLTTLVLFLDPYRLPFNVCFYVLLVSYLARCPALFQGTRYLPSPALDCSRDACLLTPHHASQTHPPTTLPAPERSS
jgi:hypothetical protein